MYNLNDYQIRFLDDTGTRMDEVVLAAETLTIARECADEIAMEIHAADFYITMLPPRLPNFGG
ncbi:MAG TPA: hypothetical protein VGG66_08745 [Rhizomicrobium sp.]|jgi:hypothetical protein